MKAMVRLLPSALRGSAVVAGMLLGGPAVRAQTPAASLPPPRPVVASPAAKVQVADVIIQGNRLVSTQQIMARLRTRPGAEYNPAQVDEDVRTLFGTRQFADVRVELQNEPDGRVKVYFLIRDYPNLVTRITYRGAKHLDEDELNTLTNLRPNTPLNPVANKMACQAIVRRYNEQGRPFAHCDLLKGSQPGDTEVIFNITEGPVVKVSDIDFTGNTFVSSARLATLINTSKKFLGLIGGRYNAAMADMDVHKLEEYYRSNGFHDVKVARELRWASDGRDVELVFHIHEGPRYQLKAAPQVHGVTSVPVEQVEQLARVKAGDWFNQGAIDRDTNTIRDYLGHLGRDARVQPATYYHREVPGLVTVHYEVAERPPARVGQVFIVGNERTRQNVILRQVPLFPGQVLAYPELRTAERNLARLNIFEVSPDGAVRPTVSVLNEDSDSEYKDILVQVQETSTGSLLFGLGVNSDAGLTGSIVLNERNFDITRFPTSIEDMLSGNSFRGAGQEFRMEAVPGTQLQRYTVSFREPFLFDSQFSLGVSGYYYTRIYDEYNETRLGTRVTLGRKLGQYSPWTFNTGVRVENVGVEDVPPFAPVDFQEVKGDNLLVGVRAGLVRDTRDSFLRATQGSQVDLSFEQIFGDLTYPLLSLDVNKYFTVYERADGSGRHVLALRSMVAWAGDNAPVYERYYAGGFRSIRGFQFRGVGPFQNGFNLGGDFLFLNSAEYQIPVKADDQIFLVGFVDTGTVEPTTEIKDYRVTAGFGARFVVPMLGPVPIALDFGFPIVKGPGDREQIFSFWLGFFR